MRCKKTTKDKVKKPQRKKAAKAKRAAADTGEASDSDASAAICAVAAAAAAAVAAGSAADAPASAAVVAGADASVGAGGRPSTNRLYGAGDMILLVGEGDFSFSCGLLARLKDSAFIVATAYESAKVSRRKHPSAVGNVRKLSSAGMQVTHGVDCRELHQRQEFVKAFTKVVFNFPHLGTEGAGVAEHQALLQGFLSSAARCLEPSPGSEVHVTLKSGEPYNSWRIQQLAKQAVDAEGTPLLRCDRVVPFEASRYPGYAHVRTRGDAYAEGRGLSDENVVTGARTTVFRLRKEALQAAGAE